jgi:site-specific recombinase XerD
MSTVLKVYFFVYKAKTNSKGLAPIVLRLKYQSQKEQVYTGFSIKPQNWNKDKYQVKNGESKAIEINQHLKDLEQIARQQYSLMFQASNVSLKQIIDKLKGTESGPLTLMELASSYNQKLKDKVGIEYKLATYIKYNITAKKLQAFLLSIGKKDIRIKELTSDFIAEFNSFMKANYGNNQNTTCKHLKNLKTYIKYAVAKEWLYRSPFGEYKISYKPKEKPFLSFEELMKLESKSFEIPRLALAKDLFLLQCYTGLSFSDMKELIGSDITTGIDGNKWIIKNRVKTDIRSAIPLLPKALEIVIKFKPDYQQKPKETIFPVNTIQKFNAYLKEVADCCGINKNLSSHAGRRTFASTVTLGNGISIESISQMLGHVNTKITQEYARVSDLKISNEMKNLKHFFLNRHIGNK